LCRPSEREFGAKSKGGRSERSGVVKGDLSQ
jgi:hypothetical protein